VSDDRFYDEWGNHLGYCTACGEEAQLYGECCDDGEVVLCDDDPDDEI
jgi:hypothetical protein